MAHNASAERAVRILHVLGGMNRGGVETWLMHVLRHVDRVTYQMDFLVHTTRPGAYDEEVVALGSRIIPCPAPSKPLQYARNFRRALRTHGPYDVVHSHVHHFSGYVLRLAEQAGVPARIAHSHNDTSVVEAEGTVLRRGYVSLARRWIRSYATSGLACSQPAAAALFTEAWANDPRWQVMPYGIDMAPYHTPIDPREVRRELGIPPDAWVIGHVGRFVEQKNHKLLTAIAAELMRREPRTFLLLVGDGPLRQSMENQVSNLGIGHRVQFAGIRGDVHRLMRGAMDAFLFPSMHEGLGLVLVEAQASGLPCVISDVIPQEAEVVRPLVRRVSLAESPVSWADQMLSHCSTASSISREASLRQMEASPFDIRKGVGRLEEIYRAAICTPGGTGRSTYKRWVA